ncbi:Hpt domain-containing protein [Candidatus Leptofilum sp.]|uniref:Hpt domain-containing protein n=1 Tax=Candidatus Leptofilum sp. TaxID=3241576 RepID=UPI003B599F61
MMTQINSTIVNTVASQHSIIQLQNDIKRALAEVMGEASPETLDEMASIFLEDAVPLMDQMKEGLNSQNYASISMAAHALKGSSATIGLSTFAHLCLAVETNSKQEATHLLDNNLAILEAEYAKVQQALRAFLF